MVAGRDGRPDPGLGADPRGNDGDGGRVPCLPDVAAVRVCARSQDLCHLYRRGDGVLCRDRRSGAERHQARDRLFNLFAAGLHVRGGRGGRLWRGDVPPVHARLFQGDAVPWRRFGHHGHAPRAGHAELRRPAQENPTDLLGDDDRHVRNHWRRNSADPYRLCGLPVERRDHRERLCERRRLCLLGAGCGGVFHQLLQLAADLPDLLRHLEGGRTWARARRSRACA